MSSPSGRRDAPASGREKERSLFEFFMDQSPLCFFDPSITERLSRLQDNALCQRKKDPTKHLSDLFPGSVIHYDTEVRLIAGGLKEKAFSFLPVQQLIAMIEQQLGRIFDKDPDGVSPGERGGREVVRKIEIARVIHMTVHIDIAEGNGEE